MRPRIGVLALQGDVREHAAALESVGADAVPVRRSAELASLDGIVLPGGESTTIEKLLHVFELFEPLRTAIRDGLPAYGSCAGMILLADRIVGGTADQGTIGGLDVTVRRNAFGRQVDSFETDLTVRGVPGPPVRAVFIRAPWVESAGPDAEVIAMVPGRPGDPTGSAAAGQTSEGGPDAGRIVAVRQGPLLATSFHPEITGDARIHRLFLDVVAGS